MKYCLIYCPCGISPLNHLPTIHPDEYGVDVMLCSAMFFTEVSFFILFFGITPTPYPPSISNIQFSNKLDNFFYCQYDIFKFGYFFVSFLKSTKFIFCPFKKFFILILVSSKKLNRLIHFRL